LDVTLIGLQNAGKTSLLRVLSVSSLLPTGPPLDIVKPNAIPPVHPHPSLTIVIHGQQGGEFTIE
jgi:GTPase SAR1 family protein